MKHLFEVVSATQKEQEIICYGLRGGDPRRANDMLGV